MRKNYGFGNGHHLIAMDSHVADDNGKLYKCESSKVSALGVDGRGSSNGGEDVKQTS